MKWGRPAVRQKERQELPNLTEWLGLLFYKPYTLQRLEHILGAFYGVVESCGVPGEGRVGGHATSQWYSSCSHFKMTEVSKPPE